MKTEQHIHVLGDGVTEKAKKSARMKAIHYLI